MSCCVDLNYLVNQANSIVGGCYPTPSFASGGSYSGVLLTGSTFTVGTITGSAISGSAITGTSVTGLPTPTLASDAVTKAYADALAYQGPDIHAAVVAATTGNVTISGGALATADGKSLALNDRILVKDQADNRQNGIYYVSILGSGANGTWLRAVDADATGELKVGAQTYVQYGTVNGGSIWAMSNTAVPAIGVDTINFVSAYSFVALPAAKITGSIVDAQISTLSAAKLFGTLTLPYLNGSNYNQVSIEASTGLVVGDQTGLNGAIYLGQNGTGTGIRTEWNGNGSYAIMEAVLTATNPVTLTMRDDASTTGVVVSSAGSVTATGTVQSGGLNVTGNGVVIGDLGLTTGTLSVLLGNISVPAGLIFTSGVTILPNDVFAPFGTLTGSNLQISNDIILTGKTISTTTGDQTINEASGTVLFAAAATLITVTNSLVDDDSIIMVSLGTNDSTAELGAIEAYGGAFDIRMKVAPTATTRVNFFVTN